MKYSWTTTLLLVALFMAAQYVGLAVVNSYIYQGATPPTGVTVYPHDHGVFAVYDLPGIGGVNLERPAISEGTFPIEFAVILLAGTAIVLLLMKLRSVRSWRALFVFSSAFCICIAIWRLVAVLGLPGWLAAVFGVGLAAWKVLRPNALGSNFAELFTYAGVAVIFLPFISVWAMVVLLVGMSGYDAFAVWKSKHMVALADFQRDATVFAGLSVPTGRPPEVTAAKPVRGTAILGGGDVAFPLLFATAVLKTYPLWAALLVPVFATASLLLLILCAKPNRYYPAIPFLACGCLAGLAVVLAVIALH